MGQSKTRLADGRQILIAGEHEDYYDPDYEAELRTALGVEPDLDLFETLLVPPVPHARVSEEDTEYGVFRLNVNGIVIRYVVGMYSIEVTCEGSLDAAILNQITEDLRDKLTRLESAECDIKWLRYPPGG